MKTKKIWLWDDDLKRMQLRVFDYDAEVYTEGYVRVDKLLLTEYMQLANLTERLLSIISPGLGPVAEKDTIKLAANISKKVKL